MARASAIIVLLLTPLSATAQASRADAVALRIDSLFAGWITPETPGCAVGLSRNHQTVFQKAYGLANLETGTPNTPETIFEAASIAKEFTAMAVLLLVRDGKLSLDDDVRKYVPELPTTDPASRSAIS